MRYLRSMFLLTYFSALLSISFAQWQQLNGPENGRVFDIAIEDSIIYAATFDYVYKSTDNGTSWNQIKNGFNYNEVISITSHQNYVFAGTTFSGLYMSKNYGNSWTTIRGIVTTTNINSFAWCKETLYVGGSDGIYKTTDLGESWEISLLNNFSWNPHPIYTEDSIIIVGVAQKGAMISTNYGYSWSSLQEGLNQRLIYSLCKVDSFLYAGTDSGLFRIRNYKQPWEEVDTALRSYQINDLMKFGEKIFAAAYKGILITKDNGKSWQYALYKGSTTHFRSLAIMGNEIIAGSDPRGIFYSLDSGKSWSKTNTVVKRSDVNELEVKDSLIIVRNEYGIFVSTNEGNSWTDLTSEIVDNPATITMDDSTYYAGSYNGFFKYNKNTMEWDSIVNNSYIYDISINGDSIYLASENGLLFSDNKGKTFSVKDSLILKKPAYRVGIFDSVLLSNSYFSVFISSDRGKSWINRNVDSLNNWINVFFMNDSFYYAGTSYGLFRTSINDTQWHQLAIGSQGNSVYSAVNLGSNLFLGTTEGVFYSKDLGKSWINAGRPNQFFNSLTIGINNRKLFTGGPYFGVWSIPLSNFITTVENIPVSNPKRFLLAQNYPNPFNPTTKIEFDLPKSSKVTLKVYDVIGREVATLVNEYLNVGRHSTQFNASHLTSGVYFYRISADNFVMNKKMLLLK